MLFKRNKEIEELKRRVANLEDSQHTDTYTSGRIDLPRLARKVENIESWIKSFKN